MDRWLRTSFLYMAATTMLVIAALYLAERILAPLAVAGLLSVVLSSAVSRVERLGFGRFRLGRIAAVLVVAIGIGTAFAGTGWIVVNEGSALAEQAPAYRRTLQHKIQEPIDGLRRILRQVRKASALDTRAQSAPPDLMPPDADLVGVAAGTLGTIASFAAQSGVVLVLLIFLLIEREDLRDRVLRVMGRGDMRLTGSTLRETSDRVARYLRSLALLNLGHGIAVGVGLALIGLPGALLFGLIAGLLRFVPYAGPMMAAIAPVVLAIGAFEGWSMAIAVIAYLAVLELFSNNVFEPWLYGKSVGLSPFAVILAALFWSWLWGPIGLVLATPLTVCVVVMGRHVPGLETFSILLSDTDALDPSERIYERLLARDLESATQLVAAQNRDQPAVTTWDQVLIPALHLLERDRQTRALVGEELFFAREAFDSWIGDLVDSPAAAAPSGKPILCVPAEAFADEIVAVGLARLLECEGNVSRALGRLPTAELVELVSRDRDAVLCLSALDSRAAPVRHLVRRLRASAPERRIIVGFWGEDTARISELRASVAGDAGIELVSTLEEAVALLAGAVQDVKGPASPAARDGRAPDTC